jgi:branched-chain amino acid transport system substrate-binding protein
VASTAALLIAGIISGCAGQANTTATVSGSTLTIYLGQPPQGAGGPQTQDVLDAERLALQQAGGQVGQFKIRLVTAGASKTSDNARRAIADSSAIAYIGEIAPLHGSADSLGITNGLPILQVSPTDTAIDLTQKTPAVKDSPTKWYESLSTNHRTFARVVPNDIAQSKALVAQMNERFHATKVYVADDGSDYGRAFAVELAKDARAAGLTPLPAGGPDHNPTAAQIKASGADALFFGGRAATAVPLFNEVAAVGPKIKLFSAGGVNDGSFDTGLLPAAQKNTYLSSPGFREQDLTAAGKKFVADFQTAYHRAPQISAIFGYEAVAAVLDALRRAGGIANQRSKVVQEFMNNTKQRSSVLGTYSISADGDTSLAPYVFSRFQAGKLVQFAQSQG